MDALTLFLHEHARVHSPAIAEMEGEFSTEDTAVRGLTDDQLRLRPHGLNSIAWILWHTARTEDVAINVIVAGRRQVFDDGNWAARLKISRRDVGTGMTFDEVSDLSAHVDIPALREYRAAVGRRTRDVAKSSPRQEWDAAPDLSRLSMAVAQGAFGPNAGWVERFWAGKNLAWFFSWVAVGHNFSHLGQARWVKKLIREGTS